MNLKPQALKLLYYKSEQHTSPSMCAITSHLSTTFTAISQGFVNHALEISAKNMVKKLFITSELRVEAQIFQIFY